jgi:hypothetical protein
MRKANRISKTFQLKRIHSDSETYWDDPLQVCLSASNISESSIHHDVVDYSLGRNDGADLFVENTTDVLPVDSEEKFISAYNSFFENPYFENPYESNEIDDICGIDRNIGDFGNESDEEFSVEKVKNEFYTFLEGFNVVDDIDHSISKIQLYNESTISFQRMMGLQMPYEGSPYTTVQFQQAFFNVGRTFGVNQHAVESYMRVLKDHLPEMKSFQNPLIEDTKHLITLEYKYCENNCMVFATASQKNDKVIKCTKCITSRIKTLYYRPIT